MLSCKIATICNISTNMLTKQDPILAMLQLDANEFQFGRSPDDYDKFGWMNNKQANQT